MEENKKILTINKLDGSTEEVEEVISFEFNDTKKRYVVYTKNEVDQKQEITEDKGQTVVSNSNENQDKKVQTTSKNTSNTSQKHTSVSSTNNNTGSKNTTKATEKETVTASAPSNANTSNSSNPTQASKNNTDVGDKEVRNDIMINKIKKVFSNDFVESFLNDGLRFSYQEYHMHLLYIEYML